LAVIKKEDKETKNIA